MQATRDMTEGNITKSILFFALPIFVGNIFQQMYNVVDTAIIGNVLGDISLAAVGASSSLYGLVIGFANGFGNGFSVVLARYFGARDEAQMKKVVAQIYVLSLVIAAGLTIVSQIFLRKVLILLKTPDGIIDQTDAYMRVILLFVFITVLYNMFSAILRAIGNSRTPLYFLVLSSVINVVLDIWFVKYLDMGVQGAAAATVIAQGVSVLLCIVYIYRKCSILAFDPRELSFDTSLMKELLSMGFSMTLMIEVVQIGSVALQSAVNSLGEQIIAAHTAGRKVDEIFMMPFGTLTMACSTFTGQNYGAGKIDRIQKGIKSGIAISMCWAVFCIICAFAFGFPMIRFISGSKDAQLLSTAVRYLRINISFFPVLCFLLILRSSLQGVGHKIVPVCGSIVEMVLKFVAAGFLTNRLGYLGVCIIEPITWCICAVMVIVDFALFIRSAGVGRIFNHVQNHGAGA